MSSYNSTLSTNKKIDFWVYLILIFTSFIFLLLYSTSTSPLYSTYGGDSAVFTMFGRMFNSGKIPYLDFFDHKGPMVIFIQAFAQKIYSSDSRLSTFILQIINISIIQILLYKTSRLLLNSTNSIVVCLIFLIFFRYTIEGGNLTEEYSLLFISITFYINVKILLSSISNLSNVSCMFVGLCSAMLFWIRLNNTGVVFSCILFILILLLKEKLWKRLFFCTVFFLIGFSIISIPLVMYFLKNNAFMDMINAAFIHNLKYVEASESEDHLTSLATTILHIFKAWVPFIILIIGTLLFYLKTKKANVLLFSALLLFFGYFTTHIGNAYYHYMTLNIPSLLLGIIYLMHILIDNKNKISKAILTLVILCLMVELVQAVYVFKPLDKSDTTYPDKTKEITNRIPLDERNSVYAYQVQNGFLPSAGLQPCYKYFMMQEWTGIVNKHIIIEINEMMEKNPPKWVVTQNGVATTNTKFWEVIDRKYSLNLDNGYFRLYHLNDSSK